jgi:hypothetical protein
MTLDDFTPEQLNELREKFQALPKIEERLAFWKDTFRVRFSLFTELSHYNKLTSSQEQLLNKFYINPFPGEAEKLNLLILEEIKELDKIRPNPLLIDYDAIKTALDEKLSTSKRPIPLLEKELESVNEEVSKWEEQEPASFFEFDKAKRNNAKSAWMIGYNDSYLHGKEFELETITNNAVYIAQYHNGYYTGELKYYIQEKIKNPTIKKVSAANKETSLRQQLLLLRFTGLLDNINDWKGKDKSKFLSILLNRNEKNIETALATLYYDKAKSETWTPTNLKFLIDKLAEIGLSNKAEELKIRLIKLEKEIEEAKNRKD